MIVVPCEQGTDDWRRARMGMPTASQFDRILTPRKRQLAAGRFAYRNELLTEWYFGEPVDAPTTQFMGRGTELEPEALARYEFEFSCDVQRVGFITSDDARYGCSPDGLVDGTNGLEIKSYGAVHHIGLLLDPDDDAHACQVQGSMLITGGKYWVLMRYHPSLPPAYVRAVRDEGFIAALSSAIDQFCDELAESKERLLAMGVKPQQQKPRDKPSAGSENQ